MEQIAKKNNIDFLKYSCFRLYVGDNQLDNDIPSQSKKFREKEITRLRMTRGVYKCDIEFYLIEYSCKDMDFEMIDSLIYPNEYKDKK